MSYHPLFPRVCINRRQELGAELGLKPRLLQHGMPESRLVAFPLCQTLIPPPPLLYWPCHRQLPWGQTTRPPPAKGHERCVGEEDPPLCSCTYSLEAGAGELPTTSCLSCTWPKPPVSRAIPTSAHAEDTTSLSLGQFLVQDMPASISERDTVLCRDVS